MKPSKVLLAATLSAVPACAALSFVGFSHHTAREVAFTDEGVTVAVRLHGDKLVTTFTPQRPGFHVYSIGLPDDGIEGMGRPTRVQVAGSLHSRGALVAKAPVHMLPLQGTDLAFPVYPDGPVTTELPITVDRGGAAKILVSYAACSPAECMVPVTDHPLELSAAAIASLRG